jgi:CO/xanthine dehydrogenase FAD-binding subunit
MRASILSRQPSTLRAVDVFTPPTLDAALLLKAEHPDAVAIQGGTDVMVEMNFDRGRPPALLNLNEVGELRGWSRENGTVWLGAGLTYTEAMEPPLSDLLPALAEAARTVGGPQIRNRGTIGGNLATASPAGDAIPPLLVGDAQVKLVSVRGERVVPLREFFIGPKRNVMSGDELIAGVYATPTAGRETFMKIGPRNAMVISVVSLALRVDGDIRAAFGSAGPVPTLVRGEAHEVQSLPDRVAEAASPIDDVRGTAAYRRHALRVLTRRALERCLA